MISKATDSGYPAESTLPMAIWIIPLLPAAVLPGLVWIVAERPMATRPSLAIAMTIIVVLVALAVLIIL